MPPSPAPFVWYELMTTDASAAEKFYKDVVGWKAQDMSQGDMKYTGLLAAGMPVAGLMTLPKDACAAGAKPGWTGYIGVDDVDATAARVTKAGGKIHVPPTDIPNVGRFAMMADPQGAVFCLFKPRRRHAAPGGRPEHARPRRLARALCSSTARRPSLSTPSCSAGPRPRRWIWARWASTSCSRPAARRSAA